MKKLGDFHDGCLEGFWVDDPVVHIFLKIGYEKTDGAERFAIIADGVAALAASDFRKGHIILDVETKTHEELTSEDIRLLYDVRTRAKRGRSSAVNSSRRRETKNWQPWRSLLAMERRSSFWPDPLSYLIEEIGRGSTARA
jgi:hypothetical protein